MLQRWGTAPFQLVVICTLIESFGRRLRWNRTLPSLPCPVPAGSNSSFGHSDGWPKIALSWILRFDILRDKEAPV